MRLTSALDMTRVHCPTSADGTWADSFAAPDADVAVELSSEPHAETPSTAAAVTTAAMRREVMTDMTCLLLD